jgi:hypothetical protein
MPADRAIVLTDGRLAHHASTFRLDVMSRQESANVGLGTSRRRVTISWLAIRSASQVFQNATPVDDRLNLRNAVGTNRARITARSRSAICQPDDKGIIVMCTRPAWHRRKREMNGPALQQHRAVWGLSHVKEGPVLRAGLPK